MLNDPLASALSKIMNAEKVGKQEVTIKPVSKVLKKVFEIMQDHHYLGEVKEEEDGKGNFFVINLLGKLNNCGSIKPRFSVTLDTYEKFEKRYLPARGFGFIIISTSQGMMTHEQAKEKKLGGKLIAYCY
jgi:small subunit ribosomal protein S8